MKLWCNKYGNVRSNSSPHFEVRLEPFEVEQQPWSNVWQLETSSDQKQNLRVKKKINETKIQIANRKESLKHETQGLLDKVSSLEGLLRTMSVFEQYLKGNDERSQNVESKIMAVNEVEQWVNYRLQEQQQIMDTQVSQKLNTPMSPRRAIIAWGGFLSNGDRYSYRHCSSSRSHSSSASRATAQ